jgi:hypothetical protein
MFKVYEDGSIELTRGDTAYLNVEITDDTGKAEYAMQPGDTLTLSVKKQYTDAKPCIQKIITDGKLFHIEPSDTSGLEFGKYKYDVQLTTESGDVFTVIGPETFEIKAEVTCE